MTNLAAGPFFLFFCFFGTLLYGPFYFFFFLNTYCMRLVIEAKKELIKLLMGRIYVQFLFVSVCVFFQFNTGACIKLVIFFLIFHSKNFVLSILTCLVCSFPHPC